MGPFPAQCDELVFWDSPQYSSVTEERQRSYLGSSQPPGSWWSLRTELWNMKVLGEKQPSAVTTQQSMNLHLTVVLSQRSCQPPAPAPVHPGSNGQCAAGSGHTAASGWCTDRGRTSPADTHAPHVSRSTNAPQWISEALHTTRRTSFMVKTSFVAPACCSKLWNSTFGLTWTHRQEILSQTGNSSQPAAESAPLTSLSSSATSALSSLSADIMKLVVLETKDSVCTHSGVKVFTVITPNTAAGS